jgi:hypothetical protein
MPYTIASFDIGVKNFAQYVEETDLEKLEILSKKYHEKIPSALKKRVKTILTPDISAILEEMFLIGERKEMGVYDLTRDVPSGMVGEESSNEGGDQNYDMESRRNIFKHLEKYRVLWDICDMFMIEQQYFNMTTFGPKGAKKTKGGDANVKAIKIAETVASWFLIMYPTKKVIFFGSQYKTQSLGAEDGLTKPQRKKWSVEKAVDILTKRQDEYALDFMKRSKKISKQKQDDVCDTLIQCQAYKFREYIQKN